MQSFDMMMSSVVGEQYITLTGPLIRTILNNQLTPSNRQITILGMQNSRTADWVRKLTGVKVSAQDFADLSLHRPSHQGKKNTKKRTKSTRKGEPKARQEKRILEAGFSYDSRNRILFVLGFSTYKAYLRSSMWKHAKTKALHEKGGKCMWCEKRAVTAHHSRYDIETLKGTTTKHLWPICETCHHKAEFYNNTKTGLKEANDRLGITPDGVLEFPERIHRGLLD